MKKSHGFSNFSNRQNPPSLPRTDLACESFDRSASPIGASFREYSLSGISVSELIIENEEGSRASGRPCGRYLTIQAPFRDPLCNEERFSVTEAVSLALSRLSEGVMGHPISRETRLLVAGLGNRFISADSIGPRTADKISVTGHVLSSDKRELFELIGCASICAVHPGVMGQTGIEAVAMIKGAAEYVRPDIVIAVDALAARSTKRLCSTVQLSDTGIEPGSGIGNRRGAVNSSTVGFPVIAMGVPTVVDCATLVCDILKKTVIDPDDPRISDALDGERELFVSLRDCDTVSEEISSILAQAINRAFFAEGL